jgi:hypothetical protein
MSYEENKARAERLWKGLARAHLGRLSEALQEWMTAEFHEVSVEDFRGPVMLSVSDEGLRTFEQEETFKSYRDHNHMFADLLVPLSSEVTVPIVFWISPSNPPGVSVQRIRTPKAFVLSLGQPYSFASVCASLNHALRAQGAQAKHDFFSNVIRSHGLDPADPAFSNLVPS